jgi:hypothetical protein
LRKGTRQGAGCTATAGGPPRRLTVAPRQGRSVGMGGCKGQGAAGASHDAASGHQAWPLHGRLSHGTRARTGDGWPPRPCIGAASAGRVATQARRRSASPRGTFPRRGDERRVKGRRWRFGRGENERVLVPEWEIVGSRERR